MAQVHINPEIATEFRNNLNEYVIETRDRLNNINQFLQDMGNSSWTDERFIQYNEMFQNTFNQLQHTLSEIEGEQIPYIEDAINKALEYER